MLQLRSLKHRTIKQLAHGHPSSKREGPPKFRDRQWDAKSPAYPLLDHSWEPRTHPAKHPLSQRPLNLNMGTGHFPSLNCFLSVSALSVGAITPTGDCLSTGSPPSSYLLNPTLLCPRYTTLLSALILNVWEALSLVPAC